jgi:hypothetical protein
MIRLKTKRELVVGEFRELQGSGRRVRRGGGKELPPIGHPVAPPMNEKN